MLAAILAAGAAPSSPESRPASVVWANRAKGIRLEYPADWHAKKSADYELMLVTSGANSEERRITVDIPDLPPHLPWMIQMSRVEHDYLADLKNAHPDLRVDLDSEVKLPQASARLVRSSWRQNRQVENDVVLLIIHASAVYILDARSDEPHLGLTRQAFDSIRASLAWTR